MNKKPYSAEENIRMSINFSYLKTINSLKESDLMVILGYSRSSIERHLAASCNFSKKTVQDIETAFRVDDGDLKIPCEEFKQKYNKPVLKKIIKYIEEV